MISIKKLAVTGAIAGLMLATAVPALADFNGGGVRQSNHGGAHNQIEVSAYTGSNNGNEDGKVKTGNASTHGLVVNSTNANVNVGSSCGCDEGGQSVHQRNHGGATNTIVVTSDTGSNNGNEGSVKTGNASTDGAVINLVNTNVSVSSL